MTLPPGLPVIVAPIDAGIPIPLPAILFAAARVLLPAARRKPA